MLDYFLFVSTTSHFLFMLSLWLYLAVNLQWYNYKLTRVIFYHHKKHWHLIYFVTPIIVYFISHEFFIGFLYLIYLPALYLWYKRLDKPLVFTNRIWRFFIIYFAFVFFDNLLCFYTNACKYNSIFVPMLFSIILSNTIEWILLNRYAKLAKEKIHSLKNLQIIAITASFGKTSIKNFLSHILSSKYKVYHTPRSINTYAGLIKDVNESLPEDIDFYIAEAGARQKGDILEIALLLEPHYAIVGKIGAAHIEYFKTIKNIKKTKLELLKSPRLKMGFVYKDIDIAPSQNTIFVPQNIRNIESNLDGTSFELEIKGVYEKFKTTILGSFNVENIAICIEVALFLGVDLESIKERVKSLKPIEHRLQKMVVNGKIIIDDSFNGNLDGMLEGIRLASLHNGRKVIVTPGLVESNQELNIKLAQRIDEVFDLAIITGDLNAKILSNHIKNSQKIILKDKSNLQNVLAASTKEGDLILFANDAPNFI